MPVRVEKLPDEPVLVITYEGHLDVETVKSAFTQSAALAAKIDGAVYRISDVRKGEGDFIDLMQIMAQVRAGIPGSSADPKIKGIFVGTHYMARLYADLMRQEQFGGIQIPFFKTVEEALDYIHVEMQAE
jgi:hypothetical protein